MFNKEELTIAESAVFLEVSQSTFNNWRNNPEQHLPEPIVYGPRKVRFLKSDLEEWQENRRTKRTTLKR